jgi:hypothetical protein
MNLQNLFRGRRSNGSTREGPGPVEHHETLFRPPVTLRLHWKCKSLHIEWKSFPAFWVLSQAFAPG